jgi:hypothetical protein
LLSWDSATKFYQSHRRQSRLLYSPSYQDMSNVNVPAANE